jgi:hypothetical protein
MKNIHQTKWVGDSTKKRAKHQCGGIAEEGQPHCGDKAKDTVQYPANT